MFWSNFGKQVRETKDDGKLESHASDSSSQMSCFVIEKKNLKHSNNYPTTLSLANVCDSYEF